jgi:hypothetical protein
LGIDATALGWGQFIPWLIDQKPRWSSATWWSRKAAVLCALRSAQDERADDPEIPIARAALEHVSSEGADKSTRRTSARKAKKFPPEDRRRIFAALELGRSARARDLIDIIHAGCATGLRPVEWRDAQVVEPDCGYCFKLVVVNAKSENGRGHGPTRTLRWTSLSIETREATLRTIATAASFESDADYKQYRTRLQELLHYHSQRIWPNRELHYALYSCRHEAMAVAKRYYSREEVAALFGHATDASCVRNYPRKTGGQSKGGSSSVRPIDLPVPDAEDVMHVRRRAEAKFERLNTLRENASRQSTATIDTEGEAPIEPALEPFPEPPPKNMELEEAQRRAGAELYSAHKKALEAGLDDLDRLIARAREVAGDAKVRSSETNSAERGDAVRGNRGSKAVPEAELPDSIDWTKI